MLRKLAPFFLFAVLGVAMLAGAAYAPVLIAKFYRATTPKPKLLEVPKVTALLAATGDTAAWRVVEAIRAHNATLQNANGAEIAAGQQASGWVPSATVASKFIAFAGMYLLLVLLPWWVQHLTHPAPTAWAKTRYKTEFLSLSDEARFTVYGRLQLTIVIRAAASALFAALVV